MSGHAPRRPRPLWKRLLTMLGLLLLACTAVFAYRFRDLLALPKS